MTNSPVFGSDWKPLRNGKKSTALDDCPLPSATGAPLTGFSGIGGLGGGERGGPVFPRGGWLVWLPVGGSVPTPHQLFSALTGTAVFAVAPSRVALNTP